MYQMPNRRERRQIAKQLGLLKKRSQHSYPKYVEEVSRSIQAGKEIHRQKTEEMLRSLEAQDAAIQAGNRFVAENPVVNPKKEKIAEILKQEGEKRSYSEISADLELQIWSQRKAIL